jgi:hypothetical protein
MSQKEKSFEELEALLMGVKEPPQRQELFAAIRTDRERNDLRQRAAIAAMAAMLSHPKSENWTADETVIDAVMYADLLLQALDCKKLRNANKLDLK